MYKLWAVTQRELKSFFVSPIAYVVICIFLLITGVFYFLILQYSKEAGMMRYLFSNMAIFLLLLCPAISMRLLSEEKRSGTIELLLTSPLSDAQVVVGKYLASCILLLFMLLLTSHFPIILKIYGNPEMLLIFSGYLGVFFVGATFLAIGILTSSWTKNQIIALFVSFGISLLAWFLGAAGGLSGSGIGDVLNFLSINNHFENFTKGVFDTQDIIYFLSTIIIILFLTIRSLETRRWK